MAFLSSMDISASGLTASRLRMDVISENIANEKTTRTQTGEPYRRKMVVYESAESANSSFTSVLSSRLSGETTTPKGVVVSEIVEDQTEFPTVYDPTNPDADENGYVRMPNVDVLDETLDMLSVSRAYQANLTALNAIKSMASEALKMGG